MKRKRICAWFITLAMLLTMLPSALAASFADTRGHWAEDAISRWSDRGVIQGHNGDFEPDSPITRADMAVIIDLFTEGTHFNPVDLVCATKDYQGNAFDLPKFVDPSTGFISSKSKNERCEECQPPGPYSWMGSQPGST